MILLRALALLLGGLVLGIINIGFISALPYPYSEFPLFPIVLTIAFVFRVKPSVFWLLFVAIGLTDLYSASSLGVGAITLILLVAVGYRISNEIITHRSVVGCFVIGGMTGVLWSISAQLLATSFLWLRDGVFSIDWSTFGLVVLIYGGMSAIISSLIYVIIPYFVHARSPISLHGRYL